LEADESDDSASSSDSDASDSESEPWKRRDAKRRKGGEDDATGNESLQLSSEGTVKQPSLIAPEPIATQDEQEEEEEEEAPADYDDELKEMQELLELQLQVNLISLSLLFTLYSKEIFSPNKYFSPY
jgi:hypothetical protein